MFDRIKEYYHRAEWLPFPELIISYVLCSISFTAVVAMGIPLEFSIQFGRLTDYHTIEPKTFAPCEVLFVIHSVSLLGLSMVELIAIGHQGHAWFNDCKDLFFDSIIITMFIVAMFYWAVYCVYLTCICCTCTYIVALYVCSSIWKNGFS